MYFCVMGKISSTSEQVKTKMEITESLEQKGQSTKTYWSET